MNTVFSIPEDGRMSAIIPITPAFDNHSFLMPRDPNKDVQYRLGMFIEWLDQRGQRWWEADLAAYRDYLLKSHEISVKPRKSKNDTAADIAAKMIKKYKTVPAKSAATVSAHLATIRGRYNALLKSNDVRESFWKMTPSDASIADRKAFVDEHLVRLQNAVHPTTAPVKVTKKQDEADSEHLRLTPHQAKELLNKPGGQTLTGVRDTAIFALILCTGVREAELVALNVDDLRQTYDGKLALRIIDGKGKKSRMIPYGASDWCLPIVDKWLSFAEITEGAVFRGLYRGGNVVRPDRLTTRSVNAIFSQGGKDSEDHHSIRDYRIRIDGKLRNVKPHDLRRSYARRWNSNHPNKLSALQKNLGHTSLDTTQLYIGALDGEERSPGELWDVPFDLSTFGAMVEKTT